MVVFHPRFDSLRRMGQLDVSVAPAPVVAAPVPVVPAPVSTPFYGNFFDPTAYDKSVVSLSPAGILVGGVVLIALGLSVAHALARR